MKETTDMKIINNSLRTYRIQKSSEEYSKYCEIKEKDLTCLDCSLLFIRPTNLYCTKKMKYVKAYNFCNFLKDKKQKEIKHEPTSNPSE